MTSQTRTELVGRYRKFYQKAEKREKTRILNIIVEATGYSRKHAVALLNQSVKRTKPPKRRKPSRYAGVRQTLKYVWATSNFLCGKRLKPFLPELVKSLKRHKEIKLTTARETPPCRQRRHHRQASCANKEDDELQRPLHHKTRRASQTTDTCPNIRPMGSRQARLP